MKRSTTRGLAGLSALALGSLVACSDDDPATDGGSASSVVTTAPATAGPTAATTATTSATSATSATSETSAATTTPASTGSSAPANGGTVTLLAYDSFPVEGTGINDGLAAFTAQTGIDVEIVIAGDTGTMVSKAVLAAGNPEGDVLFGIDNTFLSRAVDGGVFEPYSATGLDAVAEDARALVPNGEATPVDTGDVCVNYDIAWFDDRSLEPPADLDALADPAYRDLLVVENPATSSPGTAFMLATIARYGEDGWVDYWARLRDNGVAVTDSWTEAYYERFTWAGGGDRPLVVSYGTSPPAEVIYADPPVTEAPTAAIESTCFHQTEYAGVLAGTDDPDAARQLIDFLISPAFQQELALSLFVNPIRADVEVPAEFTEWALRPEGTRTLDPAAIAAGRDGWIETWTETVLR